MPENKFILAGNGGYKNKGCEAITRGTVSILDKYFNETEYVALTNYESAYEHQLQSINETNDKIKHIYSPQAFTLKKQLLRKFKVPNIEFYNHAEFKKELNNTKAVLMTGGDNYSLDYGIPRYFINLDKIVLKNKKPLILWGASVGPFSKNAQFEKFMQSHLKKFDAIFAREDRSVEYLNSIGIKSNVHRISDPAFVMEPKRPDDFDRQPNLSNYVGINISSLMAKYHAEGNIEKWLHYCTMFVNKIAEKHPVCLVPHVTRYDSDDYTFLLALQKQLNPNLEVHMLNPLLYSAEEIKYLIGQLRGFVGARTHSTIAAFSTEVPTLSLTYSIKAFGINKEVYGHTDYCVSPKEVEPEVIAERLDDIIKNESKIIEHQKQSIIQIKNNAYKAGEILRSIL